MMDEPNSKTWELLRAKIVHEDSWVQRRVLWLLGTTALLVTAYAVLCTVRTDVSIPQTLLRGYLMLLLPVFGLVLTALVLIGLIGSSLVTVQVVAEVWIGMQAGRNGMPTKASRKASNTRCPFLRAVEM